MISPDMSGSTTTDEGETIEVSVGVVSYCDRGKVSYQYSRNGRGYFMKNILSSLDPSGSVMCCPSTSISCSWVWMGVKLEYNLHGLRENTTSIPLV